MKIQKAVSFSRIQQILDLPDLMAVQKGSFEEFLQKDVPFKERTPQGLQAAFLDVFPIVSADESFSIEFVRYEVSDPPRSEEESRLGDLSYAGQLSAYLRLVEHPTSAHPKTIVEQQVFFGDLPLMTEGATFIINGAERVVVSQLHRSPGVIFEEDEEKGTSSYGKKLYVARIIPYRGAWVEFEFDINNILYVSMDKKKKFEATAFLCALGLDTTEKILSAFYEVEEVELSQLAKSQASSQVSSPEAALSVEPSSGLRFLAEDVVNKKTGEVILEANKPVTMEALETLKSQGVKSVRCIVEVCRNDVAIREMLKKDRPKPRREANIDIYRKLRGSEHMVDSKQAESFLENLILKNTRRYDLTRVGRYKINKKLAATFAALARRKGFSFEVPSERRRTLSLEDIVATLQYLVALNNGTGGEMDDIDHLGNRRIRAVGELLENQVRVGLAHMAKLVRDRMATREKSEMTPHKILNTQPVGGMIRKFFGTSQLSQFMDQTNPLAELTHKRRLSALGPGGLHRKRAGFEVRDVHHTHYGRICPIETPEGPNIGLITSLACHARVNEYGLIESPYQRVKNARLSGDVDYLIADKEDEFVVAQANSPLDKSGRLTGERVLCRHRGDFREVEPSHISYMDISPLQVVSVSAALIPFLEHDDANRALMGSNMQRQAVPLLITEPPWVATGIEERVAKDSLATITARREGKVVGVSASRIDLWVEGEGKGEGGSRIDTYPLIKYRRANQDTCVNQLPLVRVGERVKRGQAIADGPATGQGQLALGKNLLVAFMSWEGYNFEDAILLSERLVREDVFTSIHIQEFVIEARETKMGPEDITRDIPNVGKDALASLDEDGIIVPGAVVSPGDILVGKVVPKGEQHTTPEERLLRVIFGRKAEDVMDSSLRLPPGSSGKVLDVRVFTRKEKISKADEKKLLEAIDEEFRALEAEVKKAAKEMESEKRLERKVITALAEKRLEDLKAEKARRKESVRSGARLEVTVNKKVKVYVVCQRKIQVGDKMAGRHGNKGVVAKILPVEDMPHLPDGTPVDIVLSPLSVPSRMNVGQILETMLGWAARIHHTQMVCPVFDGAKEEDVRQKIREANEFLKKQGIPDSYLPTEDARITLYDGRTGEPFHEKVTVGYIYMMKLAHLVEDKMHARSTGPYSLITRQPLGGKAQFGGQRFGEMEVWALEGYGAAHTLQEFLTIKSDDVVGRTKMYEAIIEGKAPSPPGTPESFKVLVQELQGLGIQVDLRKQMGKDGKRETGNGRRETGDGKR